MIRVELPSPLRTLAGVRGEVQVEVSGPVTQKAVIDAIEARWPGKVAALVQESRQNGTSMNGWVQRHKGNLRAIYAQHIAISDSPPAPWPAEKRAANEPKDSRSTPVEKTHCPSGHPYDSVNLATRRNGHRRCRECDRIRSQARRNRILQAA